MNGPGTPAIRLARPADADGLPEIEKAAGALFAGLPGYESIADHSPLTAQRYASLIAKRHCLVAADGDRIAGFIACEPFRRELHIREMSVHPRFQRQGLGERLVRATIIDARNEGFDALTLTTFRDIPWNAPFYARLGFVIVEDSSNHARLHDLLEEEDIAAPAGDRRVAMIRFLD
ncbi:GNAT family N-acetyltransferase [Altererythrobacter sp. MTPC7]|uniref:GNAT family N-acetyltransferase n=1 Tax=Altererythrobacter sp. MTPC7 TaxID=3056567 RepID=UPI0036F1BBE0